jgi:hypothetical protein
MSDTSAAPRAAHPPPSMILFFGALAALPA